MVHNMQLITHNSLSPIFSARCNINARAASYSLGMMPSKMASLMALFKALYFAVKIDRKSTRLNSSHPK